MAKLLKSVIRRPALCDLQYYLREVYCGYTKKQSVLFKWADHSKFNCYQHRLFSTDSEKEKNKAISRQTQSGLSEEVRPLSFKETTKTASYLTVILIGVTVTGGIFYFIFKELFSSNSPNNVYSKALDRVIGDTRIQDALGEPISGYGEENRRGRRQHVSHLFYQKEGEKRLRMKFYISGSRKRATVHLEMREDESGKFIYRYLFVELDDFGRHPIVLEDNRNSMPESHLASKPIEEFDLSAPLNMNLNFPDAELK